MLTACTLEADLETRRRSISELEVAGAKVFGGDQAKVKKVRMRRAEWCLGPTRSCVKGCIGQRTYAAPQEPWRGGPAGHKGRAGRGERGTGAYCRAGVEGHHAGAAAAAVAVMLTVFLSTPGVSMDSRSAGAGRQGRAGAQHHIVMCTPDHTPTHDQTTHQHMIRPYTNT